MTDSPGSLPPEVTDLVQRGMVDARAGRTADARRVFEQALALDPACSDALLWLAALAPGGETSLRYLARVLEINPNEPRAHAGIRWARKRVKPVSPQSQPTVPMPRVRLDSSAASVPAPRVSPVGVEPQLPHQPIPRWQLAVAAVIAACILISGGAMLSESIFGASANAAALPPIAQVTPAATAVLTPKPSATWTPTVFPTATPTPLPTGTPVPSPTPTETPTVTPIPLPTATPYIPPPPTAAIPPAGGDFASRWIDVNLSTQSATAFEGDAPVKSFIVSTGLPGTPTVTGQFHIYARYDSQTMSGPGYYLPGVQWVQYFYQGYALHGTYWHNNFGHPMSHGCVNMTNGDAAWLWTWADFGTVVNIHY